MKKNKRIQVAKIIVAIIIVAILCGFIIKLAPFMANLYTEEGQIAFKAEIDSMGFKGILLLFTLQILQILLVILPGEPFEVLAGMCYGTWGGFWFITISVLLTTTLIFFTVRKLGQKYLYHFFKKEKVNKILESKVFKNPANLYMILFLLFFLPGTPKDLFVYIGGLLPVKPIRFIMISTFARFPSVITSTMVGARLSQGNWEMSLLIYLITFVVASIIIYLVGLKDKNKDIINIIK